MADSPKIIYTLTDEAPALATRSLLPIIQTFAGAAGVGVDTRDISLAGRIVAAFSDRLPPEQRAHDALAELGLDWAAVTHRWAARAAFTTTRLPIDAQPRAGVHVVGGYSGHGNVIGSLLARQAARRILASS